MHEADSSEALIIPQFLSADEVAQCFHAEAVTGHRLPDPTSKVTLCEALAGVAHDIVFSSQHVALYLHRSGYFQQQMPSLFGKLIHGMQSQPGEWVDPETPLYVRCIELHTYTQGAGLLDPGHRDNGSILSMAVLLSDASEMQGGQFVTYSDGLPIVHEMQTGDAILFRSEKCHNVATVVGGTRHSLVVELWKQRTNDRSRFC